MAEPPRPAPKRTPRVLVVEDERRMRALLADVLPDMGFEPVTARTAEEAERSFREDPADVLLLDLNLPATDGMTFLRKLREKQPHMPVVIMTGFGDLASAQEAIHLDVVEFLSKPAHLGQIEAALDRARRRLADRETEPISDAAGATPDGGNEQGTDRPQTLAQLEQRAIREALERNDGNRAAAARQLGISRRTLYNRLREAEVDQPGEATANQHGKRVRDH